MTLICCRWSETWKGGGNSERAGLGAVAKAVYDVQILCVELQCMIIKMCRIEATSASSLIGFEGRDSVGARRGKVP